MAGDGGEGGQLMNGGADGGSPSCDHCAAGVQIVDPVAAGLEEERRPPRERLGERPADRYRELKHIGELVAEMLHGALDGGGTLSLKTDAQGKVFSTALLRMVLDVPDDVGRRLALPLHQ